jgi:hypothetical protein
MAANRLDQLIDQLEPVLRRAFMESIYAIRDAAQLDLIVRMLENGDVPGAIRAVGLDPNLFRPFDKAISDAFEAGGRFTATALPIVKDAGGFRTVFQFGVRNLAAETWLRTHSASLVQEIINDQREMIRKYLTDGITKGLNPRTSALDLVGRISVVTGKREGGTIGLTASQEEWVSGYADDLASDNPLAALTRGLRDKRFDGAVRKAAAKGEPVPAELRGKMVTAYRNRALRYRAQTIARTETIAALHTAQDQALDQAVGTGAIRQAQITMTWRSAHDARVRDAHRELDGQSIRKGGVFQSILGPIRYPGDPNANIANTAQCRCFLEPSVNFLTGLS